MAATNLETLMKTFEGSRDLKKGAKALGVYYSNVNLTNLLSLESVSQLASIMIAYHYATDQDTTFMEKYEDRPHARSILKRLLGIPWYKFFLANDFKKWMSNHNWTTENLYPYALLSKTTEPAFWFENIQLAVKEGNENELVLTLKPLVVAPDEDALELPEFDKVNLF